MNAAGSACTINAGVCPAGMDLHVCETLLIYQCGSAKVNWNVLMVSGTRGAGWAAAA